jgi:5-methylcytosine-specific restriction endonuclease McrA
MKPLKKNEICPLHSSRYCCGRENKSGLRQRKGHTRIAPGVTRIEDEHHERGYRILRSPAAMRVLLVKKVKEQGGRCAEPEMMGCGKPFTDMREAVPDHISPKGGGRKDDHEENIQALCVDCNQRKGSIRIKEDFNG